MPDPQLVIDVGVRRGDVHHDDIGLVDMLEHLLVDRAGLLDLVAADALDIDVFDGLLEEEPVDVVEVDVVAVDILLLTEWHDNETSSLAVRVQHRRTLPRRAKDNWKTAVAGASCDFRHARRWGGGVRCGRSTVRAGAVREGVSRAAPASRHAYRLRMRLPRPPRRLAAVRRARPARHE